MFELEINNLNEIQIIKNHLIKFVWVLKNLSYFDVNWDTEFQVDASPEGVAAVLVQSNPRDPNEKRFICK